MVAPERRKPADLVAVALIAVGVLVAGTALWATSDIRHTTANSAPTSAPTPPPTTKLPSAVAALWQHPSGATARPVVLGGTVVTAEGSRVTGRDLTTGALRWEYQRSIALCSVTGAFDGALAVYRRGDTCSEVTLLGPNGEREAQRNSPIGPAARVFANDRYAVAPGERYLEIWRSDLVKTLEYGDVPTPAEPATQPRPGCRHATMALAQDRFGLIERCPGEDTDRLTVQRPSPEDATEPEVTFSTLLPSRDAQLVALTTTHAAVALPNPPRLVVYDERGEEVAAYPVPAATIDASAPTPTVVRGTGIVRWFTGTSTVLLRAHDLRPLRTVPDTLGAGLEAAGRLLLPVPGGLAVYGPSGAEQLGTIPVDRGGYTGPVGLSVAGEVIIEQRGDQIVALGQSTGAGQSHGAGRSREPAP